MDAILEHTSRISRRGLRRWIGVRVFGLLLYAGVVAWAWWQLPETLPFVILGAGLGGGLLHVIKGRPWLGFAVFAVTVFVAPRLLWSAFGMGALSDLSDMF